MEKVQVRWGFFNSHTDMLTNDFFKFSLISIILICNELFFSFFLYFTFYNTEGE